MYIIESNELSSKPDDGLLHFKCKCHFCGDNHVDVLVQNQKSCISKFLGSIKCLNMSLTSCKNKCVCCTEEQIFLAFGSFMGIFQILCQAD